MSASPPPRLFIETRNGHRDEADAVEGVSTEAQRAALSELVASSLEWLDDDGYDANVCRLS